MNELIPRELIEKKIYVIRGQKVMLDRDLAELYGVETRILNQAVKRNKDRFPEDFMFLLTKQEFLRISQFAISSLRSQIVILKKTKASRRGRHIKFLPYAFTEQGVAMLSSVLKSKRASQVNIAIMRAFVKLREALSTHKELAHKIKRLERKGYKHDGEIQAIFEAIQQLMKPPEELK